MNKVVLFLTGVAFYSNMTFAANDPFEQYYGGELSSHLRRHKNTVVYSRGKSKISKKDFRIGGAGGSKNTFFAGVFESDMPEKFCYDLDRHLDGGVIAGGVQIGSEAEKLELRHAMLSMIECTPGKKSVKLLASWNQFYSEGHCSNPSTHKGRTFADPNTQVDKFLSKVVFPAVGISVTGIKKRENSEAVRIETIAKLCPIKKK